MKSSKEPMIKASDLLVVELKKIPDHAAHHGNVAQQRGASR